MGVIESAVLSPRLSVLSTEILSNKMKLRLSPFEDDANRFCGDFTAVNDVLKTVGDIES